MAADTMIPDDAVYMPVEQYLLLDENADGLYEYWHGQIIMLRPPSSAYMGDAIVNMAAGNPAHAAIAARLASLLDQGWRKMAPALSIRAM